jgi:hypothetical protein
VNGVEEIQQHPFFKGIDWKNIRNQKAPFKPVLKGPTDHSYFDDFSHIESLIKVGESKKHRNLLNEKHHVFHGYTLTREKLEEFKRKPIPDFSKIQQD